MPPKRKTKLQDCKGPDNELFRYKNQMELTFNHSKTKNQTLLNLKRSEDSSSSEDDGIPFSKAKLEAGKVDSSSGEDEANGSTGSPSPLGPEKEDKKVTLVDRPITPPPEVPVQMKKFSKQGSKLSRDVDIKLRSLQEVTQQDQSPVCVTAGHWSETIVVDQIGTPSPSERKITIRIRTRNGVERFSIRMNDRFEGIISDLSKKQDVPVEVISLSFTDSKGNLQTLQAFDTPTSVKLSRTDIIDCIIVNSAPLHDPLEDEENVVNIKIQGSQADSVKLFKVLKNEPLGNIMQQYADFRKLSRARIAFSFDGETISSDQTPNDLEMDEDNVVDVRVS